MKPTRTTSDTTQQPKPAPKRREGDVRHILDKMVPPGVEPEDVQDPGKSYNGIPADDRS